MHDVLPDTAIKTSSGRLEIGGVAAAEIAERFGTPVIVYDRATFEGRARAYSSNVDASHIYYAAKAFCSVAMCELVACLGLSIDVCTGGELATALSAGFPVDRILFHGNNKSVAELERARDVGVARIVVDSFEEIERIAQVGYTGKLLIRVTPGVEAHTHEFVQTGQEDSKFGFTLAEGIALDAIKRAMEIPGCELTGIHAHIGSNIFELAAFDLAVERLVELLGQARDRHGFQATEINLGGGLGIAHTKDELTPDPGHATQRLSDAVGREFGALDMTVPEVFFE